MTTLLPSCAVVMNSGNLNFLEPSGPLLGARFSAPVQTGPEVHPASCTMGTESLPGVRSCRGMTLTPHPLLVPRSKVE